MKNFLRGEVVDRTEINRDGKKFIVDTCFTNDTGRYETAIIYRIHTCAVETYANAKDAKMGHEKWCEFTRGEPVSTVVFTILDDYWQ